MQTASLTVDPSRPGQPLSGAETGYEVRIGSRLLPIGWKDGLLAMVTFSGWIFLWLAGLVAGMLVVSEMLKLPEEHTGAGELARFFEDSLAELWALAFLPFLVYWMVRFARGMTLVEIGAGGLRLKRRMGKPVTLDWEQVRDISRQAFHPGTATMLQNYRITSRPGTFHFAPADAVAFQSAVSRLWSPPPRPVESLPRKVGRWMRMPGWPLLIALGVATPLVVLLTGTVKFMAEWANTGTAYLNRPLMRAFLLKPSASAPQVQQELLVHGVRAGDTYVVRKVLDRLGSIRETEFNPPVLVSAIRGRYPSPRDALEQKGIPARGPGEEDRRASLIRLLVAHGAHIEPGTLLTAALAERPRLFATLLDLGAPLDDVSAGVPEISWAAVKSAPALALYLGAGADPNQADNDGRIPLFHAASAGRADSVELLLKHGSKPDARDFEGSTVAHAAALGGNVKLLEGIVERAGGYQARRTDGETLMHAAARGEKLPMLQHLLQHGLSADIPDRDGLTPLHMARGSATVDFLVENGADINARAADGTTPLHVAVRIEAWDNVRKLLARGARKDLADRQGKIPRDYLPRAEGKRSAKQRALQEDMSKLLAS